MDIGISRRVFLISSDKYVHDTDKKMVERDETRENINQILEPIKNKWTILN